MKRNSLVWQFFDRVLDNSHCVSVICKLCENEYKFFGNTTNLRQHLKNRHPVQWELSQKGSDLRIAYDDNDGTSIDKKNVRDSEAASETDTEQTNNTMHLVRELQNKASDVEWLEEDPFQNTPPESFGKRKKRRLHRIKKEYDDTLLNYFQKSPDSDRAIIVEDVPRKDECSVFGEYIANKLRKLKSPRTMGNVQQIITTILWQAEYGAYDSSDSVTRLFLNQADEKNDASTTQEQGSEPVEMN